jgi:hypothetical protein
MRYRLVLLVLAIVCVAAGCGGPSAGGLSGKSAEQVIALAQAAASAHVSFHFIDQTGSGKDDQVLVGDAGDGNADQTLKSPNGVLEVRRVSSTIYVNATALVLENALKLSASDATANAGKWLSLQPTDAPYQTVAKALLPSAELTLYVPVADLEIGKVTSLRGRSVLAVSGTASSAAGGTAVATLYVSTTAPFVPVGGSLVGTGSDKNVTEVAAFTAWGEKISPSVPSPLVAYSSIST